MENLDLAVTLGAISEAGVTGGARFDAGHRLICDQGGLFIRRHLEIPARDTAICLWHEIRSSQPDH